QEFQELELLDNIMALRFVGKLPRKIAMADRRNNLIALFQEHRGLSYVPSTMHKAIQWSKNDPFLKWEDLNIEWRIVDKKPELQVTEDATPKNLHGNSLQVPQSLPKKRKRSDTFKGPIQRLKLVRVESVLGGSGNNHQINIPFGTQWKQNSCAYNSVITVLFNLWQESP
ncbi:hypothetical protein L208DRAFT_1128840, partial [Tricholoma matsutake]